MKTNCIFFTIGLILFLFSNTIKAQVYFNPPTTAFATGNGPSSIITADFNGDGKKDLATANTSANNVSVLLGTGTGSFGAAANIAVGTAPYAVACADFNGDTKVDLALCNSGTNNITILLGNGAGGFGAATNFATGNNPRAIAVGDFNGDSKIDVVTANYNGADISVLLGNGTGSFGAPISFVVGTGPRDVTCADFNGDANLDLAVANETTNNVSILLGTGTGSFGAAANFGAGTNPRSITGADFNGDGKKDLVTANFSSNNVSVLLGTGTGSFGIATNFSVDVNPASVITADFNSDGKIDMGVANYSSNNQSNFKSVSVLLGTGTGSFNAVIDFPSTIWTVPANPSSLISADFNGDGKPDLALTNYTYNNVSALVSYIPTAGSCPNPMRIVILGASSSFGFGATVFDSAYAYRYRQYIIDSINGFSEVINLAHAGYTTYGMQPTGYPAPGAYPVDSLRNITKAISLNPDGVIFNFTTNDINSLISLDTTKANFLRATGMLDALGIPYWITTTQPRNFTGDPAATIAQKKQMILDLRDTIIKLYPFNTIESYVGFADVNGDILPQYDCGDHTHFTNAGHLKLFNNVKSMNIPGVLCPMLTGVKNNSLKENSIIYPNPSSGIFTLQTSKEITSVEIYNVIGEKVFTEHIFNSSYLTISISGISGGIYFLRAIYKNSPVSVTKIIISDN